MSTDNSLYNNIRLRRVTRDMSEGIIVLSMHGNISFANPVAGTLLEVDGIEPNAKVSDVIQDDFKEDNDDFFEFIIDALHDTDRTHSGDVSFITRKNSLKWFHVTTSFLFDDDGKTKEGVLVQFEDITEVHKLQQKTHDSAFVFVLMMAAVCPWSFISTLWEALDSLFHQAP